MRISQNMIYAASIRYMNRALDNLSTAQEQDSTQLRINEPSDDPSGYAQARNLDGMIASLTQYSKNITTATSWLSQADSSLTQASTVMTNIKELATEAATGTETAENRKEIATEVRSLFSELLSLSNTSAGGSSIFAGLNTDGAAYTETLGASVTGSGLTRDDVYSVSGSSDSSLLVHFSNSGTVGGSTDLSYAYSSDGGDTWSTGTLAAGSDVLDLGSVSVALKSGSTVTATGSGGGSALIIRPSALYLGDADGTATVRHSGSSAVSATADGSFSSNVVVRIASDASLSGSVSYSYSVNGGVSWVSGNVASNGRLFVPGGVLTLSSNGGSTLAAGDEFTIASSSADLTVDISPTDSVVVNNVGKDIFGGLYQASGAGNATSALSSNTGNIFETVGDLIGRLETNDEDGIGDDIAKLTTAQAHLETCAASVGARENRVTFASNLVTTLNTNSESSLSGVEDADLSQVLLNLTKYQYTYQSVLASSSKIMGLSLLNYLS